MQLCYVKKDLDCLGKCVLILLMSTENKLKLNKKKQSESSYKCDLSCIGKTIIYLCA